MMSEFHSDPFAAGQTVETSAEDSFALLVEKGWHAECFEDDSVPHEGSENLGDAEWVETGFEVLPGEPQNHDMYLPSTYLEDPGRDLGAATKSEAPVVADISACVEVAYAMLPGNPPKPVWDQGVWADIFGIFGDGAFLRNSWVTGGLTRMPLASMPAVPVRAVVDGPPRAKARKTGDISCTYSDIVVHRTDQTWQEERESILQNALKRWLVVCSYFNAKTTIRVQLDCAVDELQKLTLLADVFRERAPATLLKRVRAIEKMCHHFGMGAFPPSEQSLYDFSFWSAMEGHHHRD